MEEQKLIQTLEGDLNTLIALKCEALANLQSWNIKIETIQQILAFAKQQKVEVVDGGADD